jgi:hypothetical protein
MAEVLGFASRIATVLSLTIETYSITSTYIRGVRNATKAVGAFLAQNKTRRPKWKDLRRLLLSISKRFWKIVVLINTLDECDDTDVRDVLSLLNELQGLPKTFVRLFLTSRSHTTRSAELAFKNAQPITIMNITATQSDLENFVRDNIETHPFLQSLSPALKEEIVSTTASEAHGRYGLTLFRYSSWVADSYFPYSGS